MICVMQTISSVNSRLQRENEKLAEGPQPAENPKDAMEHSMSSDLEVDISKIQDWIKAPSQHQ